MSNQENDLRKVAQKRLEDRGVTLDDIAELVMFLQEPYFDTLEFTTCLENVDSVLDKREVQHAIITGVELDVLAEKKLLSQPLQDILYEDEGLYGIDEIMALAVVNVYGSIGFTNYGYIDKVKPGILKKLNSHENGSVHTFLDDIVGAIAAAAASRLAHDHPGVSDIMK